MIKTLEGLEAEDFEQLLEAAELTNVLEESNVTIFAPSNDAIEDFRHDLEKLNTVFVIKQDQVSAGEEADDITYNIDDGFAQRRKREALKAEKLAEILKGHMVEGFVSTSAVRDEEMIDTLGQNQLRITVYNTYPD